MIVISAVKFWFAAAIINSRIFAFLRSADAVGIAGTKVSAG